ncbi:MAG: AAA family ATPase, partial [Luteimonas sp.]|nr:AAA family ATPase [Luteimonas sp.]
MRLLEREAQLTQLTEGYDRALHGEGRLLLLHGEAGAGKTSVVQHFLSALPANATSLVAGCEAFFTARPLGPLVDLADSLPPALTVALRETGRSHTLFPDFLTFLRQAPNPKVLVIDDLHWADAGTLDLVRYVGRRLANIPVLFVATYRDDDLALDDPLRHLLGDLPAATTTRIAVPCLSPSGVSALARHANRAESGLFEITAGNPFFVTEALNCRDGVVPPSVYDATLSRFSRLTPNARALAELVAISPKWIERSIVAGLINDAEVLIDECIEKALLRANGRWVSFRHDLARQAVEQSLMPGRSAELHRRIFAALMHQTTSEYGLSRLVHHAQLGELRADILSLAPRAARAASLASAHREAAKHYALAIEYASDLDPAKRAELLELAAEEYRLVSDVDATITATRTALELRTELGDTLGQGMNLRRLAVALGEQGGRAAAEAEIAQAVATLETMPPSVELVRAY